MANYVSHGHWPRLYDVLARVALQHWPDMPRARPGTPLDIEAIHRQLDALELRLEAKRLRVLDAEADIPKEPT